MKIEYYKKPKIEYRLSLSYSGVGESRVVVQKTVWTYAGCNPRHTEIFKATATQILKMRDENRRLKKRSKVFRNLLEEAAKRLKADEYDREGEVELTLRILANIEGTKP